MRKWIITGALVTGLLAGCNAAPTADSEQPGGGQAATEAAGSGAAADAHKAAASKAVGANRQSEGKAATATTVAAMLKNSSESSGPAYAAFRKVALAEGWTPVNQPDCVMNVYGGEGAPSDKPNICEALPELESCTSNGLCLMSFQHKSSGKSLNVTTYGDYTRWNTPGEEDALYVQGGEFGVER